MGVLDLPTNLGAASATWTLCLSTKGSWLSPGVEQPGPLQPVGSKQLASLVFPRKRTPTEWVSGHRSCLKLTNHGADLQMSPQAIPVLLGRSRTLPWEKQTLLIPGDVKSKQDETLASITFLF